MGHSVVPRERQGAKSLLVCCRMKDLNMACKSITVPHSPLSTMFLQPDWNQSKHLTCGLKGTGSVLNNSEKVNDNDDDNGNDNDNDNDIENENDDSNLHNDGTIIGIIIKINDRFR